MPNLIWNHVEQRDINKLPSRNLFTLGAGTTKPDIHPPPKASHGCSAFVIAHTTGRRSNHVFHDSSNALDYVLVQVAPPKLQARSGPSTLGWDVSETGQRPGTQRAAACRQPRAAGWQ